MFFVLCIVMTEMPKSIPDSKEISAFKLWRGLFE